MNATLTARPGFALLAMQRPQAWASLVAVADHLWQGPHDAVVMELCRLRIAGILGATEFCRVRSAAALSAGVTEHKLRAVASYPTSVLFTTPERASLAYAEQLLLDAGTIDGTTRDRVSSLSGSVGLVRLTVAVGLFEGLARASLLLGFRAPSESSVASLAELAD